MAISILWWISPRRVEAQVSLEWRLNHVRRLLRKGLPFMPKYCQLISNCFSTWLPPPLQARKARNGNRGSCRKLVRDACVDLVEVVKVFQFQRNECSSQQAKRRELLQLQGGAVEFVDRTSVIHRSLHQSDGRFRVQTPTWEASSGEPHCALSRPSSLSSLSAMSRRGPSCQQGASRTGVCIAFQHI